jgi:prolyl-tRNA editing enzyme YbaK/EbsC (Cys-tRNA(Pro) deacylase)
MIDTVVRYLRDAGVAFRLLSYPSPEPLPAFERAIPAGTLLVRTEVIAVGDEIVLACARSGAAIDPQLFACVAHGVACACRVLALTDERDVPLGPIPPLAGFFGLPLIVDDELPSHARLIFRAFAPHDYVEMAYGDLAWLERPRVASLTMRDAVAREA